MYNHLSIRSSAFERTQCPSDARNRVGNVCRNHTRPEGYGAQASRWRDYPYSIVVASEVNERPHSVDPGCGILPPCWWPADEGASVQSVLGPKFGSRGCPPCTC